MKRAMELLQEADNIADSQATPLFMRLAWTDWLRDVRAFIKQKRAL